LEALFTAILENCGFKVLKFTEHCFKPQGYTALWLLAESHFALHTFPESGKTYIELSSCNVEYYQRFIELTKDM
jgi:S-adenosylmethionine/arginine decarboxylase-like enzyme